MTTSPRHLARSTTGVQHPNSLARSMVLSNHESDDSSTPRWAVGAWLALGFCTIVLSFAAAGPSPLPGDTTLLRFIQSLDLGFIMILAEMTNIVATGATLIGLTLAMTFITWKRGHREAAYLMLGATLMRVANTPLKALAESPRPNEYYARVTEAAPGFGFPSGHTMAAVLAFGAIAMVAPALTKSPWIIRLVQITAIAGILITGYGRMMTGAHWPSDVLGGLCWGILLLTAVAWIGRMSSLRFDREVATRPVR